MCINPFSILPLCRLRHLAEEGDQEVVSEVVWDIVDVAWEQVYHSWVQNEIFPYAVEDARQKLLQSIAVRSKAQSVCSTEEVTSQPLHTNRLQHTHTHSHTRQALAHYHLYSATCMQEHKTTVWNNIM